MSKSKIKIKEMVSLAPHTTFNIGGEAKFFVEIKSVEELKEAVKFAKDNALPIFVLGGGSNVLISDGGFNGLVIKMNIRGLVWRGARANPSPLWITDTSSRLSTGVVLRAGAGEVWDNVVAKAVELNAGGTENLSLIPGTVGGAVYQNIGAYGAELKNVLASVKAYDIKTCNIVRLSNQECGFEYRSSVFKKNKNLIVLEAELFLSKNSKPNLSYPDLQKWFKNREPNISQIRDAVIEIRRNKLVYPDDLGSAGSFFKNPVVPISNYQLLISKHPDLKGHDIGNGLVKLSAAQLIEKAGFKGKRVGNVGVSDRHSLVLVNYSGGTAKEINTLVNKIITAVREKFNLYLNHEVESV